MNMQKSAVAKDGWRPKVISMFSGMEAASVACGPLGWEFLAYAEIEPAACWTLRHHYGSGRPVYLPQPVLEAPEGETKKEQAERLKINKANLARIKASEKIPVETTPGGVVNLGDISQVDFTQYRGRCDIVVGGPPCFPAGTLILSKRGLVPIEEIVEGDEVLTHRQRWRKVVHAMGKMSPTVVLKGQGHWGLETTAEHPFWARSSGQKWVPGSKKAGTKNYIRHHSAPGWVEAKDMESMFWSAPSKVPHDDAYNLLEEINGNSENFLWMLGAWVGDGWCRSRFKGNTRKHEFIICAGKSEADFLSKKLKATGLHFRASEERTVIKFHACASDLVDWVKLHFGYGASEKTIPAWLFGLSENLRRAFLKGYYFADGTSQKGVKSELHFQRATTVSRKLAIGVRLLINSLGYGATIVHYSKKRDCFIEGRKVNERPQYQVSYYERNRSAFADDGMVWGRVRSVTETGLVKQVFNFEVEEDNSYVADGIVVHNCQAFSMAGNRQSLDDERGNLSLAYVRAIHAIAPVWSFTENVPGWLTTKDNAFGCFLGELVGADAPLTPPDGKKWGSAGVVDGPLHRAAWRVLDAQGFVPQRRRRVLVVAARAGSGGDPVRVLFETEAEARKHLGSRADSGPLFPDAQSMSGNHQSCDQAREETAGALVSSAEGSGGEAELTGPQAYRLHAAHSTAMMSNGKARASDPVDTARTLDSCGGFAANQGGNLVLQPQQEEWIPEVSTTLRARDAKGSPDSDCTQTLLAIMDPKEAADAIAFHGRQDPIPGTAYSSVDTDGYSLCVAMPDDGDASNHAVDIDLEGGVGVKTLAFSAKDYGADAGEVAPTLRAAPHVDSHANSGSHVGIITPVSKSSNIVRHIGMLVRRLMPSECLALQGFPTDYLDTVLVRGKEMADGPRYKLCGNSWAVPVASWVFKRLDAALKEQYQNGVRP